MYSDATFSRTSQHSLVVTFAWMVVGLLISAITSIVFLASGLVYYVFTSRFLSIALMLAQIGIAIYFSSVLSYASSGKLKGLFVLYAITLGISLTPICLSYGLGTISLAFIVTAIYFACLAVVGMTTKKDLTKLGTICLSGLFALIITQGLLALFRIPMSTRMICIIGLLLFTGITAWDMNRLTRLSSFSMVDQDRFSIYMALELYLDFINIFLYILRLLGNRRDS